MPQTPTTDQALDNTKKLNLALKKSAIEAGCIGYFLSSTKEKNGYKRHALSGLGRNSRKWQGCSIDPFIFCPRGGAPGPG